MIHVCNSELRVACRSPTTTALLKDSVAEDDAEFGVAIEPLGTDEEAEEGNTVQRHRVERSTPRLAHLSERHGGALISVDVGVNS
jgi:hypothetical protein